MESDCSVSTMQKSLAALSADAVLERIKEAAKGLQATFACGGAVKCSQPMQIYYGRQTADTPHTVLPVELCLNSLPDPLGCNS